MYEGHKVSDIIDSFRELCKGAFTPKEDHLVVEIWNRFLQWMLQTPKYDPEILKIELAGFLAKEGRKSLHSHPHPDSIASNIALVVVRESTMKTNLITNYTRIKTGK